MREKLKHCISWLVTSFQRIEGRKTGHIIHFMVRFDSINCTQCKRYFSFILTFSLLIYSRLIKALLCEQKKFKLWKNWIKSVRYLNWKWGRDRWVSGKRLGRREYFDLIFDVCINITSNGRILLMWRSRKRRACPEFTVSTSAMSVQESTRDGPNESAKKWVMSKLCDCINIARNNFREIKMLQQNLASICLSRLVRFQFLLQNSFFVFSYR